jgi:hypothetical protein
MPRYLPQTNIPPSGNPARKKPHHIRTKQTGPPDPQEQHPRPKPQLRRHEHPKRAPVDDKERDEYLVKWCLRHLSPISNERAGEGVLDSGLRT